MIHSLGTVFKEISKAPTLGTYLCKYTSGVGLDLCMMMARFIVALMMKKMTNCPLEFYTVVISSIHSTMLCNCRKSLY